MAPTLMGTARWVSCSTCDLTWAIDRLDADPNGGPIRCWHCGDSVPLPKGDSTNQSAGDRVRVSTVDTIRRGQLIAFHQAGNASIKRVVAIPGDTIDRHGLELRVNGQVIPSESTLPVDLDHHRSTSRWKPDQPNKLIRNDHRQWTLSADESNTLTYHHRSVHDHLRPSPVWDDYAINSVLCRPLQPIERLIIRGQVVAATDDAILEVIDHRDRTGRTSLDADQPFQVTADQKRTELEPVLAPENPVAIRLCSGTATIAQLSLHRPVLYRLRRRDQRSAYPLTLGDDQYFVLGDNVPISIDSRNHGPVKRDQILGVASLMP